MNKHYGGKQPHQWTTYFNINKTEMYNKTNNTARCKACVLYNSQDMTYPVVRICNVKKLCRSHLKKCPHFHNSLSNDEWQNILNKIIEEEQQEQEQRKSLQKRRKVTSVDLDVDDGDGLTNDDIATISNVSTSTSSNARSVSSSSSNVSRLGVENISFGDFDSVTWNLPSTTPKLKKKFEDPSKIMHYMPKQLSEESIETFYQLLLCATVSCGWSFNWVENQEVIELFEFINPGITLPSRKTLSNTILFNSKNEIQNKIDNVAKQDEIGLTISFDGWKNISKQSIFGAILITSEGKSLVWGASNISTDRQTAIECEKHIETWLNKAKDNDIKINAVVTDSASGFVAAKNALKRKHHKIIFLPCFAHQINLCVGDIFKSSPVFQKTSTNAVKIVSYFNESTYFLGLLRVEQYQIYNKLISLQRPGKTRWNSYYQCMDSILKTKVALKILIAKYQFVENGLEISPVICEIVNDEIFWNELEELRDLLIPLCNSLNKLQKEFAQLHEVVHCFGYLFKIFNNYHNQQFGQRMVKMIEKRWRSWEQPLLLLALILHPKYKLTKFDDEISRTLLRSLNKWLIYYYICWAGKNPKTILSELEDYYNGKFPYSDQVYNQFNNDILKFWKSCNRYNNELPFVAMYIFGICINSASVERLFSCMGFFHTKARNRTNYEKVLAMSQLRGEIQRSKRISSSESKKIKPISIDSEELPNEELDDENDDQISSSTTWASHIDYWLEMLNDEYIEENHNDISIEEQDFDREIQFDEIKNQLHPSDSKNAKWDLSKIFPEGFDIPNFISFNV
jgi:hypothetical protein